MLQGIVLIVFLVALLTVIDGVFTGFALVGTLTRWAFLIVFKGLGIILGLGLVIYVLLKLFV
mgnify:CR=1 FL=1|jgi:hypothetical protein